MTFGETEEPKLWLTTRIALWVLIAYVIAWTACAALVRYGPVSFPVK